MALQIFVWAMANALAEKGHDVHVYGGKGARRLLQIRE
jgi:hypothetical protein